MYKHWMSRITWGVVSLAIVWTLITITFGEGEAGDRSWFYGIDIMLSVFAIIAVTVFAFVRLTGYGADPVRQQLGSSPTGLLIGSVIIYTASFLFQLINYHDPDYNFYSLTKVVLLMGLVLRWGN